MHKIYSWDIFTQTCELSSSYKNKFLSAHDFTSGISLADGCCYLSFNISETKHFIKNFTIYQRLLSISQKENTLIISRVKLFMMILHVTMMTNNHQRQLMNILYC